MLRVLLLMLATLSAAATAATTDVVRETEGQGATQQEAVTGALLEAVRQVRGSAVGVDRGLRETLLVTAGAGGVTVAGTREPVADVYSVSRGYVRSYEVLEQRTTAQGVYVRIRAHVPTLVSAVDDAGRQRIAVLPFRVGEGFRLAGHGSPAGFAQRLADRLVAELSAAPDVAVVNRDFFAEQGLEKAVLASDGAPEELVRLGAAVGADFLLVGRIEEARTESSAGAYGSKPRQVDEIRVSWRMLEAATGKVLRAGTVAVDHVRKSGRRYDWQKRDDFEAGELFAALAQELALAALAREKPAAAPAPATDAPAALTPGSGEAPLRW